MGTICLSTSAILRCQSYSTLQNLCLVIPTALEVVFSTSLVFTNRGSGSRHLWLTAEGWIYFSLALLEMISHINPAVRSSPKLFMLFDKILAAGSSIPILFYTLFIFSVMRVDLVNALPSRSRIPIVLFLFLFIPVIITVTEISSFIGVSYELVSSPSPSLVVAGFQNDKNRILWEFFMCLGLAILASYQLLNAALPLYRTLSTLMVDRSPEAAASEEIRLLRGIVWITIALTVGAVESVVGFAGGGFWGALTRRSLRLLARALLVIGVIKGVDSVEDFELIRREMLGSKKAQEARRSRLIISNPRHSTFRHLTSTSAIPTTRRTVHGTSDYSQAPLLMDRNVAPYGEVEPMRRVTIHYVDGTPRLNLRLSDLFTPPPLLLDHCQFPLPESMSTLTSYPFPCPTRPPRTSLLSSLALTEGGQEVHLRSFSSSPTPRNPSPKNFDDPASAFPPFTYSLSGARSKLQFPMPPVERPRNAGNLSYVKFPPVSDLSHGGFRYTESSARVGSAATRRRQPPQPLQMPSLFKGPSADNPSSATETFLTFSSETLESPRRSSWKDDRDQNYEHFRSAEKNDTILEAAGLLRKSSLRRSAMLETIAEMPARNSRVSEDREAQDLSYAEQPTGKLRKKRSRGSHKHTHNMSIGTAPMRSTPAPTTINDTRGSLHIDSIFFPRRESSNFNVLPESFKSFNSRGVLRDSEVLGIDDRDLWRVPQP